MPRALSTTSSTQLWVEGALLRVCLLAITLAYSRLRRSPALVCFVKNALRTFFTKHTKAFAGRSHASTGRERAKPLSIRHALRKKGEQRPLPFPQYAVRIGPAHTIW